MDPFSIAAIIGGIVGLATYGYSSYTQYQQNKKNLEVAKQQYQLAKDTAEQEEQATNKVNRREADVEGILENNTNKFGLGENVLTGAEGAGSLGSLGLGFGYKNKLSGLGQNNLLGG